MLRARASTLVLVFAATCGCGSKTGEERLDAGGNPDLAKMSGTLSCAINQAGGVRICVDHAWSGMYDPEVLKGSCTRAGGTVLATSCNREGAIGGCKMTFDTVDGTLTSTTWYLSFNGSVDQLMAQCAAARGTWVTP